MNTKNKKFICENCGKEHNGSYGSGRFCSNHCRRVYCGKRVNINGKQKCNFPKTQSLPYGTWKCKFCGQIFNTRTLLEQHVINTHRPKYGPHGKGQPIWNKGLKAKDDLRISKARRTLKEGYKSGRLVAHNKGKKHTPETIAKMRKGFTKYLMSLDGFVGPNYNKSSIRFLDNLSKEKGWNLQHAENGGEFYVLGYWLDGYDKERNIVVEFDESHHYDDVENNILCERDLRRQQEIIDHLHCEFWRYNESMDVLYKV